MLCTSSRFKSTALFFTVSDSALSEILFSFRSTIFPSFVFTESLVPDTSVLNCDQSLTLAGFKPWAVNVSDGNKRQTNGEFVFSWMHGLSSLQDCFLGSRSASRLWRCASCITVSGYDQGSVAAFKSRRSSSV